MENRNYNANRGNRFNRQKSTYGYILNDRILGDEFRVIDEKGEQIDVLSREAMLDYGREHNLDLILISKQARPQVVKAIDFHKFLYQQEKKQKKSKQSTSKGGTKDIKISLFIGAQDLERFKKKTLEFLEEGYQVRIKLPLKGRELGKKPMAIDKVKEFIAGLGEEATQAVEPKMQGRIVQAVVVRKK